MCGGLTESVRSGGNAQAYHPWAAGEFWWCTHLRNKEFEVVGGQQTASHLNREPLLPGLTSLQSCVECLPYLGSKPFFRKWFNKDFVACVQDALSQDLVVCVA